MITLHALHYSRATRVLWLLADLGEPCHRVDYQRTENFRAPEALSRVHPLGKSPVIEDGNRILAESATILRYLVAKYGDETHTPPRGTPEFWQHEELLDYVESSFAEVVLQAILPAFRDKPVPAQAQAALDAHLNFIARAIGTGPLLFGDKAMLADIQMSYVIALLARFDLLADHPKAAAYWAALRAQPGYIAATEAAGPMAPPG
ncbi:glutathione S-transferase [Thioclava sp. F36-6]|uniref:glutathione S-transferase family protein n=1 Tax=Thioclava sp. F36-6 TaxID=1915316 RepID=UPI0009982E1E|nr:glutathione S-transferase [Thioclava sp. F36-6]OOY30327.1 glutathione S-transferase [Thioclava sp. F36-6]